MSLVSKITLYTSCACTISIITFVHYRQYKDREIMRQGIVSNVESRQRKKIENLYNLQHQIDLTQILKEQENPTPPVQ